MSALTQKIILFIESAGEKFYRPSQIGKLFTNRFIIDEKANNEILKIVFLEHTMEQFIFKRLTREQGLDLIIGNFSRS